MQDDMERMISNVWPGTAPGVSEWTMPLVDVFEIDNNVVLKAEIPGLKKEDIEVTATEDSISLKGEFKKEENINQQGYVRRERREGRFFRTVPMPDPINPDQVKATFTNGVLEITAPLAEGAKAKETRVPIES
jgi:HSP20 family protein